MIGFDLQLPILIIAINFASTSANQMNLIRAWKRLDFQFPSSYDRQAAIQNGHFIVNNTFPIDVDVDYRGLSWYVLRI